MQSKLIPSIYNCFKIHYLGVMTWSNILLVALGGALGAVTRYLFSNFIPFDGQQFPWATFLINTLGSLLIAIFFVKFGQEESNLPLKLLLMTGFCGGFTTFSTFSFETIKLIQNRQFVLTIIYVFGSVFASLSAVWAILQTSKN
jgi:CrcB protein